MGWMIIPAVIVFLAFAAVCVGIKIADYAMTGARQTHEEALKWQSEHYDTSWFDMDKLVNYTVSGYEGYELHVSYYPADTPSDKYVIISHGYTDNRFGNLKYMRLYLPLGYNIIIYDLRGHGENAPAATTYGIREAVDLMHVIDDTVNRYNPGVLGLHGESLGAATTVTCLKYLPPVDFAVADCPFADIKNVLKKGLKDSPFSPVIIALGSFGAQLKYHVSFSDMTPVDAVTENKIPLLLMHGTADDFIVPENSQRIYDATKGPKKICFIENAGHAASVIVDLDKYNETLKGFLQETGCD